MCAGTVGFYAVMGGFTDRFNACITSIYAIVASLAFHCGCMPSSTLIFALWDHGWSVAWPYSQHLQNLARVFGMCHVGDWQLSKSLKNFVVKSLHTEAIKINSLYAGYEK